MTNWGDARIDDSVWAKVAPEPMSGCWLWTSATQGAGYAKHTHRRRTVLGHRFFFEMLNGPILDDLQIDHVCKVTSCVNPDHMEMVTAKENVRRSSNPAGLNSRKSFCSNGHSLTMSNIVPSIFKKSGRRACLICFQNYDRAAKRALRARGR